ncbi:MAG: ssDNA-binding protein [Candidatus Dormibacteria bacterium]
MADEKQAGLYNLTETVVLTFPNLHEARAFGPKGKESGTPKFSGNFSFEPDSADLKAMKQLCARLAKARWPGRDLKELQFPFSSGDKLADEGKKKKKDREFYRGKVVMAARSQFEPRLSGIENGTLVEYEGDVRKAAKGKFYPGVLVLSQVNFVPYDGVGKNPDGVTAYLNMVLTTGKGVRLSTGQSAAEVFKGYVGSASAEDPTAGGAAAEDDEIPF